MLKIGLFTFGGGYAMIALLENEFVTKRGWLEQEEFLDVAAIAESTPGPIAINSATYIGYKRGGLTGSLAATLGITLPSFCIIYVISLFFDAFLSLSVVAYAFQGIRVAVIYLILSAGLRMLKKMKRTPFSVTAVTLAVLLSLGLALMLEAKIPAKSRLRAFFLSPLVVPTASVILIWQVVFTYNKLIIIIR
jgi:chromate transporter